MEGFGRVIFTFQSATTPSIKRNRTADATKILPEQLCNNKHQDNFPILIKASP